MVLDGETIAHLRRLDGDGPSSNPWDEASVAAQRELGPGVVRWIDAAVARAGATVRRQIATDALAPWAEIDALARQMLGRAVLVLMDVVPPPAERSGLVERRLARDIVARDVAVIGVVRAVRIMQHEWLTMLSAVVLGSPTGAVTIPELSRIVTGAVDDGLDGLLETIDDERRRALRLGSDRRRSTIEALVRGQIREEDATEALAGVALGGRHIGLVLDAPRGARVAREDVDAVVAAARRVDGCEADLRYETGTGRVWLWISGAHLDRPPVPEDLEVPSPLVVGIGERHEGVAGFRRTHVEAGEAARVGLALPEPGGRRYRDVALLALLGQERSRPAGTSRPNSVPWPRTPPRWAVSARP